MREMYGFKDFLNEMFVHSLSPGSDDRDIRFVAWRQHLWVGTWEALRERGKEIYDTIMSEHPRADELNDDQFHRYSGSDIMSWVGDYLADGIAGYYDPKSKRLTLHNSESSVKTSPLVAKVLQVFRGRTVSQELADERIVRHSRSQVQNRMPEEVYHGTSTAHFEGIVRFGLMPKPEHSNYHSYEHYDTVFFTARRDEAEYHAMHTARGGDDVARDPYRRGGPAPLKAYPLVVCFRVPDPSKIVPDADDDRQATASHYDHSAANGGSGIYSVPSEKAGMHSGLFGYRGRIPSAFFTKLLVWSPSDKTWKRIRPERFANVLQGLARYGSEYWYYRLGEEEPERGYGY